MTEATEMIEKALIDAPRSHRRLTHEEKCAAYYAVHRGFPHTVVAQAFGVSRPTITALPNPRVAQDFSDLGPHEFGAKYTTAENAEALALAMNNHRARRAELNRLRFRGQNADDQAGFNPILGASGLTLFHIRNEGDDWFYQPVEGVADGDLTYWPEAFGPHVSAKAALIAAYQMQGQPIPPSFRRPLNRLEAIEWFK